MSRVPALKSLSGIRRVSGMSRSKGPLVDVHTHVYLPRYAAELRARTVAPRILNWVNSAGQTEERLLILDGEPSAGRPVGPQYWDRDEKLQFMRKHEINISFVSSANPWLDFLPAARAHSLAKELNNDLEEYCSTSPEAEGFAGLKSLYGFGLLPLVPEIDIPSILQTIDQIKSLDHIRGVIMGTRGLGKGLDDEALEPVWEALQNANLVIFLHPHYGVDSKAFGDKPNGHVLPLALGFPFETTISITRLILAGVLDRYPSLRVMLAHSGGALPQLSSRLASCIDHDPIVAKRLKHDARFYLGQLYYDAVAYGPEELDFVSEIIARSSRYGATGGVYEKQIGTKRLLFGTDHPFFPPLKASQKWQSVEDNLGAIRAARWNGLGDTAQANVMGNNALRLFNLSE
ncbi:amidohydrolase 2 [Hygrophoropsis aurantiaca]|uniref:Amidohydrolase 2 n=1 Tax=Hygrophoropsis aurantiaca TaxID=72124 RepID=A0ACB8ANC9_9AGAM|nr:amidohydrolase 2 [Hygrophoropsis aurantiaca]